MRGTVLVMAGNIRVSLEQLQALASRLSGAANTEALKRQLVSLGSGDDSVVGRLHRDRAGDRLELPTPKVWLG